MGAKRKMNWLQLSSFVLVAFLAADVVILTIQNRQLKQSLSSSSGEQPQSLQPGDHVPAFSVRTQSDGINTIAYSDSNQVYILFVLSTTCPHCLNNLTAWNTIAQTQTSGTTILGVSLDDLEKTKAYASVRDISFYLAAIADTTFIRAYKIVGVPQTIVLRGNGIVQKSWVGELNTNDTRDILALVKPSMSSSN